MIDEIKNKVRKEFELVKTKTQSNDPLVSFLKNHIESDLYFSSHLRILPLEIIERYGLKVMHDEKVFNKYCDPMYDIFLQEWNEHHHAYWEDMLQLVHVYLKSSGVSMSPLEVINGISGHMIKIDRRRLLLDPLPKYDRNIVKQKQQRQDGSEKDYVFIRVYWIDDSGEKKRMIARHVGFRMTQVEKEVADLFYSRGFAVHRNYQSNKNALYDMVVEREGMKLVVEVKKNNREIAFNDLFVFDELQKRFKQDYP